MYIQLYNFYRKVKRFKTLTNGEHYIRICSKSLLGEGLDFYTGRT